MFRVIRNVVGFTQGTCDNEEPWEAFYICGAVYAHSCSTINRSEDWKKTEVRLMTLLQEEVNRKKMQAVTKA